MSITGLTSASRGAVELRFPMLRAKLVLAINSNHELAICPRDHIRTKGRKRLSAPAEDNKEETIELLREHFAPAADKDPADHFSEGVLRYA